MAVTGALTAIGTSSLYKLISEGKGFREKCSVVGNDFALSVRGILTILDIPGVDFTRSRRLKISNSMLNPWNIYAFTSSDTLILLYQFTKRVQFAYVRSRINRQTL